MTPQTTALMRLTRAAPRLFPLLRPYISLLVVLILAAFFAPTRDGSNLFLDPRNLLNIMRFASENGIIAIGMTLVILTGGIDLSVGALLALSAVGTAAGFTRYNMGVGLVIPLILCLGGALGTVNGIITTRLRIPSFIVTLAMLSVARGAASLWSGGYAIPLAFGVGAGQAPPAFKSLFASEVNLIGLPIPSPILLFIGAGALGSFVLHRTVFGRYVYAVGGNEVASEYSGLPTDRIKVWVFTLSGMGAGLAALIHTALVNQGSPIDGNGYELNAIAAVVIGGTALSGGRGTILGSMLGALILGVLDNILGLRNIQSEYQAILKGGMIVLAVLLQGRQRKR